MSWLRSCWLGSSRLQSPTYLGTGALNTLPDHAAGDTACPPPHSPEPCSPPLPPPPSLPPPRCHVFNSVTNIPPSIHPSPFLLLQDKGQGPTFSSLPTFLSSPPSLYPPYPSVPQPTPWSPTTHWPTPLPPESSPASSHSWSQQTPALLCPL